MKKLDIIKRHIAPLMAVCLFLLSLRALGISCPILFAFGVPCPACGATRAILSILKLDFCGYLHYHALALPLAACVLLMIHMRLFKNKKWIYLSTFLILTVNLIYFLIRFGTITHL